MLHIRATPMAALLAAVLMAPCPAQSYSTVYAFGDSLSDAGNVYLATGGAIPGAPYAAGRFSNGPTWVQDLSIMLGAGPLAPSLAGGTDFAFGGAQTGFPIAGSPAGTADLPLQLLMFNGATGGIAPGGALYTQWIGANDVLQLVQNVVGSVMTPIEAAVAAAGAGQAAVDALAMLASEGARHFVVPLLPNLGNTPLLSGIPPIAALGTGLTQIFNATLAAGVQTLAANPGLDFHVLDVFTAMDTAIADPAAYGLTNTTEPCYVGSYSGGGSVCGFADDYLFWDLLHPTAMGHLLLADLAVAAVPEPASLLLLGVGLLGLGLVHRRAPRARGR